MTGVVVGDVGLLLGYPLTLLSLCVTFIEFVVFVCIISSNNNDIGISRVEGALVDLSDAGIDLQVLSRVALPLIPHPYYYLVVWFSSL